MIVSARRAAERGCIYYVQQGTDGPIKIGVSDNPDHRLKLLQVGNPDELRLIGTFHTEHVHLYEEAMHERLALWCIRGEWFEPAPQVLALIAAYQDVPKRAKEAA